MTDRLPRVLSVDVLPLAELSAARLDGELFGIAMGFAALDEPDGSGLRAMAIQPLPPGLIAERRTAAWIWGCRDRAPAVHELCTSLGARGRKHGPLPMILREVVIDDGDVSLVAGLRVTTPVRTLLDLVRFDDDYDAPTRRTVVRLARLARVSRDECVAALSAREHLPFKARAIERIRESLDRSPDGVIVSPC